LVWEEAKALLEGSLSAEGNISENLMTIFAQLGYLDQMSPME
jgi:hypothetical protein